MRPLGWPVAVVGAGALAMAGCGIGDPYNRPHHSRPKATSARGAADAAPPVNPETDTAPNSPRGLPATPRQAAARFALQWANWTPRSTRRQYRRLAALAAPQFARLLSQTADAANHAVATASEANEARLVSVDVQGHGARRRVVVVTREQPLGAGRATVAAIYRVYLGVAEHQASGWAIAAWSQQN
jgi:hypothetical protein